MKIAFVTSTLTSGGAERVMSLVANGLIEKKHEVEIIHLNQHIVFYPILPQIKMTFVEDEVGRSVLKKLGWLRQYIKNNRPDIVIPFMEAVYCFTLFALIGVKVPVLSSERIDPRKSPFIRNILRRIFLPLTDWLVVQTQDIKNFYPGFIQKKTSVIYNPISERVFQLSPIKKEKRIISVGKLDYQKNQKIIIRAFAKIANEFPDYHLVIYGEGPLRNHLEALVGNLNLQNKVFLPGRTDRVIEELNKSSLFVFSSDFEGMSNALMEAICVGLPIVTTNVSGVSELVENGKTGYVVPCRNVDEFADSMRKMLCNESRMVEMGIKNKAMASQFKLDKIVDQWELVIEKVVSL